MTNRIYFYILFSHQMMNGNPSSLTTILLLMLLMMLMTMTMEMVGMMKFQIPLPNITTYYLIALEDINIDISYMVLI